MPDEKKSDVKNDGNTSEINNSGIATGVSSALKKLLSNGAIMAAVFWIFSSFFAWPNIRYNKLSDEFTISNNSRAVSMYVRPQMVIRYHNTVVLLTHLVGLYEHEVVYFIDGKASMNRVRGDEAEGLMSYVRTAVLNEIDSQHEKGLINYTANDINDGLHVYMSMVCGIRFQSELGNKPDAFCVVENDGIIVDCFPNSSYIEDRLRDYRIVLDDQLEPLSENAAVKAIVSSVIKEVEAINDPKGVVDS